MQMVVASNDCVDENKIRDKVQVKQGLPVGSIPDPIEHHLVQSRDSLDAGVEYFGSCLMASFRFILVYRGSPLKVSVKLTNRSRPASIVT